MKQNFLRRPVTAGEITADLVRIIGAVSLIAAAVWWGATDAGVVAFALPGAVLPRFLGVRPWFDILACLTVLVAAWSNVIDLYRTAPWWDIPVHLVCTGVLAILVYLLLAQARVVPDPRRGRAGVLGALILTTAIGLALGAVWEMVEWLGHAFITDEIFVAYDDTIGDMAVGGLGALAAGLVLAFAPLLRRDAVPAAADPAL